MYNVYYIYNEEGGYLGRTYNYEQACHVADFFKGYVTMEGDWPDEEELMYDYYEYLLY